MNLKTALVLALLVCSSRHINASAQVKAASSTESSAQLSLKSLNIHAANIELAAAFDAYATSMQHTDKFTNLNSPSLWAKHVTLGTQLVAAKAAYYAQKSKE